MSSYRLVDDSSLCVVSPHASDIESDESGRPWRPSTNPPTRTVGPQANIREALVGTDSTFPKRASDQGQESLQSAQRARVGTTSPGEPADSIHTQGRVVVEHPTPFLCMAGAPPVSVVASAPRTGEGTQQAAPGTVRPIWDDTGRRKGQSQGSVGNPSLLHLSVGTPRTQGPLGPGSAGAPRMDIRPDARAQGNKRGAGPLPLSPPTKRKKRSGKRGRSTRDIPSESNLMGMLQAFAAHQGWDLRPPGSVQASSSESEEGMSGPSEPIPLSHPAQVVQDGSRAPPPAALGAPPGEESLFPPSIPTIGPQIGPPSDGESISESVSGFTVRSSSPTPSESDSHPLRRMGLEAQVLLQKYLPDRYKQAGPDEVHTSLLFRQQAPSSGIPLTRDFQSEFDRVANVPSRHSRHTVGKSFAFQEQDYQAFFKAESLSPDTLAVGERLAPKNPLRSRAFKEEDARWASVASQVRSGMRLSAYMGALISLNAQAAELNVSPADRAKVDDLLLTLSGLQWSQLSRAAIATTRRRRQMTLQNLGVNERDIPSLTQGLPFRGPYLFAGQFPQVIEREVAGRKQAAEIAQQLQRPRGTPGPPPRQAAGGPMSQGRQPYRHNRQVTVTVPGPGPARPFQRGKARGKRSTRGPHQGSSHKPARGGSGF